MQAAQSMALAVMSYFGGFDAFSDALMQYSASTLGLFADIGVPVFLFCMVFFLKRRQWFCFLLAAVFWVACSGFTVKQSAKWLEHKLDAAQQPVERAKKSADLVAAQTEEKLRTERKNRDEAHELNLKGTTQAIRENASRQEDKAKAEIRRLETEQLNRATAAPAEAGGGPVKSPLVGFELLVTFILWALSQGCWFMASANEANAEREPVQGQSEPCGPSETPTPRKARKAVEPVQGGATVISMNRARAPQDYRSMSASERSKAVAQFRGTGMSQREIAIALGWSKSAVQRAQDDADEAQSFKPGPIHAVA